MIRYWPTARNAAQAMGVIVWAGGFRQSVSSIDYTAAERRAEYTAQKRRPDYTLAATRPDYTVVKT